MKQNHIVIISNSIKFRRDLAAYLKTAQNQLKISSYSYTDIHRIVNTASDSVIIADTDADVASVEEIASTLRKALPSAKLLIVSKRADTSLAKYLKRIKAVLIPKPVPLSVIRLNIFRNSERFEIQHENRSTEHIVASFLLYLKIPPNIRGFILLRSAIAHIINTPALSAGFSMKGTVYPYLQEQFGVSQACAERAMRYVVSAYAIPAIKSGLTDYIYFSDRLTCRGFIAASAYYINDILTYNNRIEPTFESLIDENGYFPSGNI